MRYTIPLICFLVLGCNEGTKQNPLVRGQGVPRQVVAAAPTPRADSAKGTEPTAPSPSPPVSSASVPAPPPPAPAPTSTKQSLYERLGGEIGIASVVDDFIKAMANDPRIKQEHRKHFQEGDVAALKKKLVDQIGEATGGPQKYTGKSMKEAHQGLQITNADFEVTVEDLIKALDANKVNTKDKDELLGMLAKMRDDVVEKKD